MGSIDFKGWFRTQDGQCRGPLTIRDGASRYLLHCQVVRHPGGEHVRPGSTSRSSNSRRLRATVWGAPRNGATSMAYGTLVPIILVQSNVDIVGVFV